MSERDEDGSMGTCRKCGKAFDRTETPEFGCGDGVLEDYCDECGPELGRVDCERLRDFVEEIIDDCERSQHYARINLAIWALETELEMKAPERATILVGRRRSGWTAPKQLKGSSRWSGCWVKDPMTRPPTIDEVPSSFP